MVVFSTERPLIALARHEVQLGADLIDGARQELLGDADGDSGFRSGYLLGVEADGRRESHPCCTELVERLLEGVVAPVAEPRGLEAGFSFLKSADGKAPAEREGVHYGGPHLDSHPRLADDLELFRILVNLCEQRRRFTYVRTDRRRLQRAGVEVGRSEFAALRLPGSHELARVDLPGRRDECVFALHFLASAVPHVGVDEAHGYFLASFEAVADPERIGSLA